MVKLEQFLAACFVAASACVGAFRAHGDEINIGPAFSKYRLTLESGLREDMAGPFFYEQTIGAQRQWALPPFYCRTVTPDVGWSEWDFLYPVINYRRFGPEYRWQIAQVFSISGGDTAQSNTFHHTTVFPFYFHQRSTATNDGYTAVFPFYGHLENRMFRNDIKFVMFPLWSRTEKKDVVTYNYMYPFYDVRHGNNLEGWQIWPFYGIEQRLPRTFTNTVDELETIGGYDKRFVMWPFGFRNYDGLGTTNPVTSFTLIPLYSQSHSPLRDQLSYGFPLGFNVVHDRGQGYDEHDFLWPLFVRARGSKTINRVFPFYSHAEHNGLQSDFYGFLLYKYNRLQAAPLDRHRSRVLYFLYSDTVERNTQSHDFKRRVDFWPFYSYDRELDGNRRLQILAILDPLFPNNRTIPREYSPVYTLWHNEKNARTGATCQSLLWNFYRRETRNSTKKASLFFGLFQYESTPDGTHWRFGRFGRSAAKP